MSAKYTKLGQLKGKFGVLQENTLQDAILVEILLRKVGHHV